VTLSTNNDVYYDPYDVDLNTDPYPMFRRIREDAPLYFNDRHGFHALSRYDVDTALADHDTFSSALLGIPEADQQHVVDHGDSTLRTERGGDELLLYLQVIATAGSETTTRLLGWAGKVLPEHPDQRRDMVRDRTMLPAAIEELLPFEPPAPHISRYVTRDLEYYGQRVLAGSAMMLIVGAANRDPRRFGPDSEMFNIHREPHQHLAFGVGTHFCLGNALARLEGRIALDEILDRFPEWDLTNAELSPTSTVRGWESMPAVLS
jgi:cytochrome P450